MRALGFEPKKEEIKKMIADIGGRRRPAPGQHARSIVINACDRPAPPSGRGRCWQRGCTHPPAWTCQGPARCEAARG
jgi:hypothetical protein